jgi:phospholipid transport system transporter-binding protein
MSAVKLPATATLAEACALLGAIESGPDEIDASALRTFDTSAVALLLEARRRAQARGTTFTVRGANPKLMELARLYGVDELLSFEPT